MYQQTASLANTSQKFELNQLDLPADTAFWMEGGMSAGKKEADCLDSNHFSHHLLFL